MGINKKQFLGLRHYLEQQGYPNEGYYYACLGDVRTQNHDISPKDIK